MAEKKPPNKKAPGRKAAEAARWTAAEKAAMRARSQEMKAEAKGAAKRADGEKAICDAIAEMPASDRRMAKKIHAIVTATAPDLMPRTWYGMPAYAKDGKVVCFFQAASKFDARYATFGFNDAANLDAGAMWPTSFALTDLTAAEEARIAALVKKAAS